MNEIALLGGLGAAVFAATDVDDILVLVGFFAQPRYRARDIVIGQYLGIGALVAFSVLASLISLIMPAKYVGLLGLIPIAIGARGLWGLRSEQRSEAEPEAAAAPGAHSILTVAGVSIANGGDNVATYTPLFASRHAYEVAVIVAVFAIMVALWCFAARWLVTHPTLGGPLRRHGRRALPFVLIGLGLLILYEGGSAGLLWHAA